MKIILLFVLTLLALPGFSQSEKESNTQLKKDLAAAQMAYDSIHGEHTSRINAFNGVYTDFRKQLNSVTDKRRKAQGLAEEIVMKYWKLKKLGIDPSKLIDTNGIKRYNLPNYHLTELDAQGLSNFVVKKEIQPLNLEGMELEIQNEQMSSQLSVYQSASRSMKREVMAMQNLESTVHILDSLNTGYDKILPEYSEKASILQAKLDEEKEKFRLQGPDGFSKAYRSAFPDVFPEEHKEIVETEKEWKTMEPAPFPAERKPEKIPNDQETIYDLVDEPAEFPGGMTALKKYVDDNLVYPQIAKDSSISGRVYVQFVVSAHGYVSNVKIKKGIPGCPECDSEAVRVVKNMPKWNPGKTNGKAVHSLFNLPVKFESK